MFLGPLTGVCPASLYHHTLDSKFGLTSLINRREFVLLLRAGVSDDVSDENVGGDVEDEFIATKLLRTPLHFNIPMESRSSVVLHVPRET